MRRLICLTLLALGVPACAAGESPVAPEASPPASRDVPAERAEFSDSEIHGRWRIVSLNGRDLSAIPGDSGDERVPRIAFTNDGYGGTTGCNSFGGLGVLQGDRYYAAHAMQTAIGCGDLTAQEDAIIGLIAASPRLTLAVDGKLTLSEGQRSMLLRRDPLPVAPPRAPWSGTRILAGTSWTIGGIDGRWLPQPDHRTLRFEGERWSLTGPCGPMGGQWRQEGDRIVATATPATRACAAEAATADSAIGALLSGEARFDTGPNGEILIGGRGHWVTGERPRAPLADDAPLLAGNWRIVAIDGAAPIAGTEPRIAFGPTGYSGSGGCNSFQGYFLAHGRRFFSQSPMSTEMACGPTNEQEEKVVRILTVSPGIALNGEGEILLVGESGSLRLRRDGPTSWAPEGRLWSYTPLQAELTSLNASPLQRHYSEPETRLRLSAQRFDIDTGCGRIGGIWRRRPDGAVDLMTDAEPEPAGECAGALSRRLPEFSRMLNGPARVLIGASGELLIAGEQAWLAGRVLTSPRRRR